MSQVVAVARLRRHLKPRRHRLPASASAGTVLIDFNTTEVIALVSIDSF